MKSLTIVVVLAALVGLMAYTNPSRDDFSNYIRQYVMKESQKRAQGTQIQLFAPLLGSLAGSVVSSGTVRADYIVFSTYEFQMGQERIKVLGLFKNFILLEKPDLKEFNFKDNAFGGMKADHPRQ
jgi:hypothetical protein